ncbi:MAG: hypothetical protein EG824_00120 [Deltaproteobacteria bacterium]|nr:hypothetical protein [Deltaproteobacteria bacterium]
MQALLQGVVTKETPVVAGELRTGKSASAAAPIAAAFFGRLDKALKAVSPQLACEKGCSYCCYYHVYVYPVEALALAEFVKKLDEPTQAAINRRLADNLKQISNLTVDQHIATNVRCALLGDDGKCIAYALRPLACRKHHSVDGISCKVTFDDTASPMNNTLVGEREAVATGYVVALTMGARSTGVDTMQYEMNGALSEALSNAACLKRWKDGKATFPSVRDRSGPV